MPSTSCARSRSPNPVKLPDPPGILVVRSAMRLQGSVGAEVLQAVDALLGNAAPDERHVDGRRSRTEYLRRHRQRAEGVERARTAGDECRAVGDATARLYRYCAVATVDTLLTDAAPDEGQHSLRHGQRAEAGEGADTAGNARRAIGDVAAGFVGIAPRQL